MRNLIKFFILFLVSAFLFTGCKEDAPAVSEFDTLTTYLAQNDLDLPNILDGWVKGGSGIGVDVADYSVPDYYVMDLRGATDFDAGHIKDAVNVTLANVIDEAANANGKPILMVCYTGQTAARATGALRLMGFEAYTLKWGMSAWHPDFAGKWNSNAGDYASSNWVNTGDPLDLVEFTSPKLSTGETDGAAILTARVKAALNKDWTISKTDVLDNPGNYFVNNKWPITSWESFGHVDGAYRIDEDLNLAGIKYIDPDATIVTYCYTGQTSSISTMWLDVLGYNGRSMMFGANGIVHSDMVGSSVAKKCWKGEGSASELNFGYYDASGNLISPE